MVLRVAQVKCYSCGRVCGEVKGEDLYRLRLQDMYVPQVRRPVWALGTEPLPVKLLRRPGIHRPTLQRQPGRGPACR